MEALFLTLRIFLSCVFAFAAYGKFLDHEGTSRSLIEFGVDEDQAPVFARILPSVELGLAILLLPLTTYLYSAAVSLILLLVFTGFLSSRIGKVNCHCFGQISKSPVSEKTLYRNGVLAIIPLLILMTPNVTNPVGMFPNGPAAVPMIWLIFVTHLLLFSIHLLAANLYETKAARREFESVSTGESISQKEVEPPDAVIPVGMLIPDCELENDGKTVRSLSMVGEAALLVFASPGCGTCSKIPGRISDWQKQLGTRILVISTGDSADGKKKFAEVDQNSLYIDTNGVFADFLKSKWTPSACLIDCAGRISSGKAVGMDAIEKLVESGLLKNESPVLDSVIFSEIKDAASDLEKFALINWDEDCSFCVSFAAELSEIRSETPFVVVTTRSSDSESAGSLNPIQVSNHDALKELGIGGTPSAVLVNKTGLILSDPFVGADEVRRLLVHEKIDG